MRLKGFPAIIKHSMRRHPISRTFLEALPVSVMAALILIGTAACRKPEKSPEVLRLLDMTTSVNIMETPFTSLGQHFESIRQTFTDAPVELTSIFGDDSHRVWGFSTPSPILDFDAGRKPQYCRVYKGQEVLPYLDENPSAAENWRWMKGEETVVSDRVVQSQNFSLEHPILEHSCLLPEGRFNLLLHIRNHQEAKSTPRLQVFLDGDSLGVITLRKINNHHIKGYARAGRHTIRVAFAPDTSPAISENVHFSIKNITIKSFNDLILLYRADKTKPIPETGSYAVSYIEEPFLSDYEENPDRGTQKKTYKRLLFQLHRFNQDRKTLLGIRSAGENPFYLKKKLPLENNSCNVIFAPTPTVLAYDLEVPDRGRLEFGYGLLRSLPGSSRFPVEFSIQLHDKETTENIFSARINPSEKSKYRLYNHIDLGPYAGRKVRLEFKTRLVSENQETSRHISDSYWFNPVLYPNRLPEDQRPNIILVSLDTLRPGHLKSFGYSRETSPNLDSLMQDSVTFRRAISTAPSTLRAHMSLFTGLNTNRHQVYTGDNRLHSDIPTLTEILRAHGYTTCALTGGGRVSAEFGFDRGFDRYLESTGPLQVRDTPEILWDLAQNWLERNRNKRFFLFLHTYQIHGPYQNDHPLGKIFLSPDDEWKEFKLHGYLDQFESPIPSKFLPLSDKQKQNIIALYDGEIRYTDECLIKPLVETLKRMKMYDDTLLVIVSDHGEEFYEHKMWLHGVQLYDELIKVLCVIKFPGNRFKGHEVDRNVRIIDIMPTILEHLDIMPKRIDIDGRDMMPLILGKKDPDRTAYADVPRRDGPGHIAVVVNRFKLILNRDKTDNPANPYNPPELELYDLESDPQEQNNLAESDYATVKSLLENIEKYIDVEKSSRGLVGEKADLDPALLERLKALGYIN